MTAIQTLHCICCCMSVLVKLQHAIQTTAWLGNASVLKRVCEILSPVATLRRKHHRQIRLLTAVN